MPILSIPGLKDLKLRHLVMDYNGTLAFDGFLQLGVAADIIELSRSYQIHILTADTYGQALQQFAGLPVTLRIIRPTQQAEAKLDYLHRLGPETVVAIGNGRNDRLMLEAAALGIAVLEREGTAVEAVHAATLTVHGINHALGLLRSPARMIATLRS